MREATMDKSILGGLTGLEGALKQIKHAEKLIEEAHDDLKKILALATETRDLLRSKPP